MRRRNLLVAMAGLTALSGCSGLGDSQNPEERTEASSQTDVSTEIPEESLPGSREVIGPNFLGVHIVRWVHRGQIRYFDSEAQELRYASPDPGHYYSVTLEMSCLGDEAVELPRLDEFRLVSHGDEYDRVESYPGVDSAQIRQELHKRELQNYGYLQADAGDSVGPGRTVLAELGFVAPEDEDFLLEWSFEEAGDTVSKTIRPPE